MLDLHDVIQIDKYFQVFRIWGWNSWDENEWSLVHLQSQPWLLCQCIIGKNTSIMRQTVRILNSNRTHLAWIPTMQWLLQRIETISFQKRKWRTQLQNKTPRHYSSTSSPNQPINTVSTVMPRTPLGHQFLSESTYASTAPVCQLPFTNLILSGA